MKINLFWFRRDLRLDDNAGLYHALRQELPVLPVFVFDTAILDQLEDKADRRVEFIRAALEEMQEKLVKKGASLLVIHGSPQQAFEKITAAYDVQEVFTNHDYEPAARERDQAIRDFLKTKNIAFRTYKDQVIFEKQEVVKDNGEPYTVFTPYSKKWLAALTDFYAKPYPTRKYHSNFLQSKPHRIPSLKALGFTPVDKPFPARQLDTDIVAHYDKTRDIPGIRGTTRMGLHLRFGTVSIRALVKRSQDLNATFLKELIWRDFFQMILWHFPHVGKGKAFRADYDNIQWRYSEPDFERWCQGQTGYPMVDAGMRELNETGFMHNRVRMVVASFLAKHLLIDWRWGEAYFAVKLLDYDLAANNGNWQWAAGSGCDAAPYFRVFNPALQAKKFDPDGKYIRKWIPELESFDYPEPIVAHEFARKRCLEAYAKALKKEK
ncbi:MAG: deoxyribodipyrimidine photo-lyase [Candidatus Pseudobacter hemicellulosilyticus]|uniref:Deoxyribodipyrimidine photo-lyase n=1 Tax=Candidatus Pseudobacter hemicellulosilyticus TaxID=3121375 RepID=A0AAJ5WWW6_9BACT|nr:MAG: deoxyribodipyrimidine photo-lyase [Pseudobacter sp.]